MEDLNARPGRKTPLALARSVIGVCVATTLCTSGCDSGAAPASEPSTGAGEVPADPSTSAIVGKVSAVSGPGGLRSTALPQGTFLGAEASLHNGQEIATPKGTLAELTLRSGMRVRMNEDTKVVLPTSAHPDTITLQHGELVVMAGKVNDGSIIVAAGEDRFEVRSGEAQVRRDSVASTQRYAMVHGQATLRGAAQTVELGAGQSVETPLPVLAPQEIARAPEPRKELSLRPLEDTGWARTFDAAVRMGKNVPRGIGNLTARRAGTRTERQQLRLTDQHVTVNISGRMAHTEVEQTFFNDRALVLEGIYRFPMPSDGSISGLQLLVGNNWMQGEIVEKQRARRIFSQIVDATIPRDPALLEWERGNIFKLRVFPIPGRGSRKVKISYTQALPSVGGKLRYRYPLGGSGATGTPIDRFSFTIKLDENELDPTQLANLSTPMLALERTDADGIIELHTEREHFLPTFDLGVDVPLPKAIQAVHSATHLDQDGQAYFMVTLQPEFDLGADNRPVDYAFVLDRSHSTTPETWTTARGILDALSELMDSDDRFTVLACDTACDEHTAQLQAPTTAAVESAQAFLNEQDLVGASDLGGALLEAKAALEHAGDRKRDARKVVVYLGDGSPTSGEMAADGLSRLAKQQLQGTRVMAVALGSRSDLVALGAVVNATGGDLVRADARDDLRNLVRELRLKAEVPAASDIEFDLPEGLVMARHDSSSALRSGDRITLAGKLRHPVKGDVKLRGRGPNGPIDVSFPVDLAATREGSPVSRHLPRTWAKMQIEHLTRTKGAQAREEIIALSKDYTVLSRHTALLVLENDAMFREFNVVRKANKTDKWRGKPASQPASQVMVDGKVEKKGKADEKGKVRSKNVEASAADKRIDTGVSLGVPGGVVGGVVGKTAGADVSGDETGPSGRTVTATPSGGDADNNAIDETVRRRGVSQNLDDENGPRREDAERAEDPDEPSLFFRDEEEDQDDRASVLPSADPAPAPPPAGTAAESDLLTAERFNEAGGSGANLGTKSDSGSGYGDGGFGRSKSEKPRDDARPKRASKPKTGKKKRWSSSRRWIPARRRVKVRTTVTPSRKALARVEALRVDVQRSPTKRSAHSRLVRAAMRADHVDALKFAKAWAEVDPDHSKALTALADALARDGSPVAMRAYASGFEVRPFQRKQHQALAQAYANKGDLRRACSHRRAVVSIDPSKAAHHAELITCLQRSRRTREATFASDVFVAGTDLTDVRERTAKRQAARQKQLTRSLSRVGVRLHRRPELRATLTWAGAQDLDIALVDSRGRRLSSLRPAGKVRVRENSGTEELTIKRVRGALFIEVSPVLGPNSTPSGPIHATLELRTPQGRKSIPVVVRTGTQRLAKVSAFTSRGRWAR